jgi:hypothetical protein
MEIDPEILKNLFKDAVANLKALDTEISALKIVLLATKTNGYPQDVNAALEFARNTQQVQKTMEEKYQIPLERSLRQFDKTNRLTAVLKLFESMKPTSPIQ